MSYANKDALSQLEKTFNGRKVLITGALAVGESFQVSQMIINMK